MMYHDVVQYRATGIGRFEQVIQMDDTEDKEGELQVAMVFTSFQEIARVESPLQARHQGGPADGIGRQRQGLAVNVVSHYNGQIGHYCSE